MFSLPISQFIAPMKLITSHHCNSFYIEYLFPINFLQSKINRTQTCQCVLWTLSLWLYLLVCSPLQNTDLGLNLGAYKLISFMIYPLLGLIDHVEKNAELLV